jgi:hypothetical protein
MGIKANRMDAAEKGAPGTGVYEALLALNQGYTQIADSLQRLEQPGLFQRNNRRALAQGLRLAVEETCNWINFEVAEVLQDRARNDWSRLGQLRQEWEDSQDRRAAVGGKAKRPSESRKSARAAGSPRRKST